MFKILALLALALVSPACFAAPVFNLQSSFCSGVQSSSPSSTLSCIGDLVLNGGFISDFAAPINLAATGTLTLANLTIVSPQIQLVGGSFISMSNVSLNNAGTISLTAGRTGTITWTNTGALGNPWYFGSLLISPANPIPVPIPSVPEPSTHATMLIGLLFLAGLLRTSRTSHISLLNGVASRLQCRVLT